MIIRGPGPKGTLSAAQRPRSRSASPLAQGSACAKALLARPPATHAYLASIFIGVGDLLELGT